jgi:hypothetical protein
VFDILGRRESCRRKPYASKKESRSFHEERSKGTLVGPDAALLSIYHTLQCHAMDSLMSLSYVCRDRRPPSCGAVVGLVAPSLSFPKLFRHPLSRIRAPVVPVCEEGRLGMAVPLFEHPRAGCGVDSPQWTSADAGMGEDAHEQDAR